MGWLVKGQHDKYKIENVVSKHACQVKQCRIIDECSHFTYIAKLKECYLKTDKVLDSQDINKYLMHSQDSRGVVFGPRLCIGMKTKNSIWSFGSFYNKIIFTTL